MNYSKVIFCILCILTTKVESQNIYKSKELYTNGANDFKNKDYLYAYKDLSSFFEINKDFLTIHNQKIYQEIITAIEQCESYLRNAVDEYESSNYSSKSTGDIFKSTTPTTYSPQVFLPRSVASINIVSPLYKNNDNTYWTYYYVYDTLSIPDYIKACYSDYSWKFKHTTKSHCIFFNDIYLPPIEHW